MLGRGYRGGFLSGIGSGTIAGDVTVNGNMTMGSGKVLTVDSGTGAGGTAPLTFRGCGSTTGLYASTADQISVTRLGAQQCNLSSASGVVAVTTMTCSATLQLNGSLLVAGAFRRQPGSAKTSSYVLLSTDNIMVAGTGCSVVTTPASPSTGQSIIVMNQSGGAVTLTANSGQTIDGASTATLADNSMTNLQLANDGLTWYAGEAPAA